MFSVMKAFNDLNGLNLLNGLNRGFLAAQWSHKISRLQLKELLYSLPERLEISSTMHPMIPENIAVF